MACAPTFSAARFTSTYDWPSTLRYAWPRSFTPVGNRTPQVLATHRLLSSGTPRPQHAGWQKVLPAQGSTKRSHLYGGAKAAGGGTRRVALTSGTRPTLAERAAEQRGGTRTHCTGRVTPPPSICGHPWQQAVQGEKGSLGSGEGARTERAGQACPAPAVAKTAPPTSMAGRTLTGYAVRGLRLHPAPTLPSWPQAASKMPHPAPGASTYSSGRQTQTSTCCKGAATSIAKCLVVGAGQYVRTQPFQPPTAASVCE